MLLVGLFPPIFSSLGAIWKDVAMGSALILAFSLLLITQRRASRTALVGGVGVLLYAYSLRLNAGVAILPLAIWAGYLASKHIHRPAAVLAVLIFLGMSGVVLAEDEVLVNDAHLYPLQQVLVHDLTAMSVQTGQVMLPVGWPTSGGPPTLQNLRCVYLPDSAIAIFGGSADVTCGFQVQKVTSADQMFALAGAWVTGVWDHPGEYLNHRLAAFSAEFDINNARTCYPLQSRTDANALGVQTPTAPLTGPALDLFGTLAYESPLYRGWLYLVLIGLLLPATRWLQPGDVVPALVLGASGLVYGLTELVVSTSCDFRLHWWTVVAAVLLLGMVIRGAARHRSPS
jgi:hypothetical protein